MEKFKIKLSDYTPETNYDEPSKSHTSIILKESVRNELKKKCILVEIHEPLTHEGMGIFVVTITVVKLTKA